LGEFLLGKFHTTADGLADGSEDPFDPVLALDVVDYG